MCSGNIIGKKDITVKEDLREAMSSGYNRTPVLRTLMLTFPESARNKVCQYPRMERVEAHESPLLIDNS